MSYYVVRDYSHTDRKCLWKVLSRPMVNLRSALDWANSTKAVDKINATKRRQKEIERLNYFVVQPVTDDVDLKSQRALYQGWSISFHMENNMTICELKKDNVIHRGEGRSMNESYDEAEKKLFLKPH